MFRVGDEVEVIVEDKNNFIGKGSYGKIIDLDDRKVNITFEDNTPKAYIDFDFILENGRNHTKEELLLTDSFKGKYYTIISRLRLRLRDWEERINKVKDYEG